MIAAEINGSPWWLIATLSALVLICIIGLVLDHRDDKRRRGR